MPRLPDRIDVRTCAKYIPPHPCDPPPPCDPLKKPDEECPQPYVCLERLKNPAWETEIRPFINVKACAKVDPPHPCDLPEPPCTDGKKTKKSCNEPMLCFQRIKNPQPHRPINCKVEDVNSKID
ncbi:uncharacterized protein LOC131843096 isoform X2 [Achroia grisella]|uniref:uncharacterized protein LOC131843096 isoform X2 n=1 Tax=Achroia grisella TaxID=688607 RepID=UPI0027D2ABCE|nr:uncharacterized protein LOC131843096 isoform X2 [Achroia grisella]